MMQRDVEIDYFLMNTRRDDVRHWLGGALTGLGALVAEDGSHESFVEQVSAIRPGLVFLDFSGTHAQVSGRLAEHVVRLFPTLPLVAVGHASEPEAMLMALRAGVRDFIDLRGNPSDATAVVKRLMLPRSQVKAAEPTRRGGIVAVLGARPGVGASTLAG